MKTIQHTFEKGCRRPTGFSWKPITSNAMYINLLVDAKEERGF